MATYYQNQLRNYYYGGNAYSGSFNTGLMYYGNVQVNAGTVYDSDALNFINTAGISNNVSQFAINTLVVSLKNNNLWNEMYAIYPFVGGTFDSCKYNLKNTSTYTLTINGSVGPGFSNAGVTFTGIGTEDSGLLDTGFTDSGLNWLFNSASMGYYCNAHATNTNNYIMGCNNNSISPFPGTNIGNVGAFDTTFASLGISTNTISGSDTGIGIDDEGLYSVSANNPTTTIYKNGTFVNSTPVVPTFGLDYSGQTILIGGVRGRRVGTSRLAFAYVGKGLNGTQISNLNTIVETFQTTLGRQAS